eukprot:TRINITY_DN648_c0_g1_i2.p1 TRINITY_DN648_c0_g1~~TRINITY_DN648_c0_g1_i2.p1  ORF type:complete len:4078 (-),score=690.51 TRINITY_DN648_c0_g1_i2:80-12022(-)
MTTNDQYGYSFATVPYPSNCYFASAPNKNSSTGGFHVIMPGLSPKYFTSPYANGKGGTGLAAWGPVTMVWAYVAQGAINEGAVTIYNATCQSFVNINAELLQELRPSDPQTGSNYGSSIAGGGYCVMVSSPNYVVSGQSDAGKVYLYCSAIALTASSWTENVKLTNPNTPNSGDLFGNALAYSIDKMCFIIGCKGRSSDRGIVYTYCTTSAAPTTFAWGTTILYPGGSGGDLFGTAVAADHDCIYIGAPGRSTGVVSQWCLSAGAFTLISDITSSSLSANAMFGSGVAASEGMVAIGGYLANSNKGSFLVTTTCRAGEYWQVGYHAQRGCIDCPAGHYCPVNNGLMADPCIGGTYSAATRATSITTCTNCLAGTFSAAGSPNCTQCSGGSWSGAAAGSCTLCVAGTWNNSPGATAVTSCLTCGNGTWSAAGFTSCTVCVAGTASNATGATSISTCVTCASGSYTASNGAASCSLCTQGNYCQNGAVIACNSGTFANVTGLSSCYPCPPGTYTPSNGASACTPCLEGSSCLNGFISLCAQGSYANQTGLSICTACDVGSWSNVFGATSMDVCTPCQPGTYGVGHPNDVSNCTRCPMGTYLATSGASTALSCLSCPPGTYGNNTGLSVCLDCSLGTFSAATGAQSNSTCQPCATGTWSSTPYITAQAQCIQCVAGTFNNRTGQSSVSACIDCDLGTWSNTVAASSSAVCTSCEAGTWSSTLRITAANQCTQCLAGTYGNATKQSSITSCYKCDAGFYSGAVGANSSATCVVCPKGTWSAVPGASVVGQCTNCAAGTFGNQTAQTSSTSCYDCGAGRWSSVLGATSEATCTDCVAGTWSNVVRASAISQCTLCVAGTYGNVTGQTSITSCYNCSAGYWSSTAGAQNASTCTACVAGTWSATVRASSIAQCTACVAGTFGNATAQTTIGSCYGCDAGYWSSAVGANSAATCTACVAGTWSNTTQASTISACLQCVPGTYGNASAQTTIDSCYGCDAGYWNGVSGANSVTACTACVAGTWSAATRASSVWQCTACVPGTFGNATAQTTIGSCYDCDTGYWSSVVGANSSSTCTACVAGTWSNTSRAASLSACQLCSAGTFGNATAQTTIGSCYDCDTGYWSSVVGANSISTCTACVAGTWSDTPRATSLTACQLCSAGTFGNATAQTTASSCYDCGSGYWSAAIAANTVATCTACLVGTWSAVPRATHVDNCTKCDAGTYGNETAQTTINSCYDCPLGYWSGTVGAQYFASCTACAAGQWSNTTRAISAAACVNCVSGTWNGLTAQTSEQACLDCALGTYSNATAATSIATCSDCVTGTWSATPRISSQAQCIACVGGTFGNRTGQSSISECHECDLGYYSASGTPGSCSACVAGTWSNKTRATVAGDCVLCVAGYWSATVAASDISSCQLCLPGTFGNLTGVSAAGDCNDCPIGQYCDGSIAQRTSCPAGTVNTLTRRTSLSDCIACAAGTYSGLVGAYNTADCLACPLGTWSNTSAATSVQACTNCSIGYYSNTPAAASIAACAYCPAGTYGLNSGLSAASDCNTCSPGYYCYHGVSTACPAGTWSSVVGATGVDQCTSCVAGRYSSALGASSIATCELCAAGTYSTAVAAVSSATCLTCPQGSFCTGVAGAAELCPAGTWGSAAGFVSQYNCTKCAVDYFSTATGATSVATCGYCLAGSYGTIRGAATAGDCPQCTAGYYCDGSVGQRVACGVGTYSATVGASLPSTCAPCAAGTYNPNTGSASVSACTQCSPGYYSTVTSASSIDVCTACAVGTYSTISAASTSTACGYCPAGTYGLTTAASSVAACVTCTIGFYCDGTTGGKAPCDVGTFSATPGAVSSAACQLCPAGSFSAITAQSNPSCNLCFPGTYGTVLGATSPVSCQQCPSGTYNVNSGSDAVSACTPCPSGTYSAATGASTLNHCNRCSAGTYSTALGATSILTCAKCPVGTYSTTLGAGSSSSCIPCVAGTYSTAAGAGSVAACQACRAGYYCPGTGSSTACSVGTYNPLTSSVSVSACVPCNIGTYSTATQASSSLDCKNCPLGSFGNTTGAISVDMCYPCPAGTYGATVPLTNPTQCTTCQVGYWCSGDGTRVRCLGGVTTLVNPATKLSDCDLHPLVSGVSPAQATNRGGTLVTVIGWDMGSGSDISQVLFGTTPAVIISQSKQQVLVQLPFMANVGTPTVTTRSATYGELSVSGSFTLVAAYVLVQSSTQVTEGAVPTTFSVALSAPCDTNLVVPVAMQYSSSDVSIDRQQLVFTPSNWNVPQTVSIVMNDDYVISPVASFDCAVQIGKSIPDHTLGTGMYFANMSQSISLQCMEADKATTLIQGVTVLKDGESQWATIQLTSIPSAVVTVSLDCTPSTRLSTPNTTLVFTPQNWNVTQRILLTYPHSNEVLSLATGFVRQTFISDDLNYFFSSGTFTLSLFDGASNSLVQVTPPTTTLYETGPAVVFTVMLSRAITAGTVVFVCNPGSATMILNPMVLNLVPADYSQQKYITITPAHDFIVSGNSVEKIFWQASYLDRNFAYALDVNFADMDVAGLNITAPSQLVLNETGTPTAVVIQLSSLPLFPVTVVLNCTAGVFSCSQTVIVIEQQKWNFPNVVIVRGLADYSYPSGDKFGNLRITATSQDVNYRELQQDFAVVNRDINFPYLANVYPQLVPMGLSSTLSLTCVGANFSIGLQIFIDGVSAPVTYMNSTYVVCTLPVMTSGYHNVTAMNTDGGFSTRFAPYAVYYTADCPTVGYYGRNGSCFECPVGGLCPGGDRMWPQAGYWTTSEFATAVTQCDPPAARCLGGPSSQCLTGYEGPQCTQCSDDYYSRNGECMPCDAPVFNYVLFGIQALPLIGLVLLTCLMTQTNWGHLQGVYFNIKLIWLSGALQSAGFPEFYNQVFAFVSLLVGDLTFSRPGCVIQGYPIFFGINFLYLSVMYSGVVVFNLIHWRYDVYQIKQEGVEETLERMLAQSFVNFKSSLWKHVFAAGRFVLEVSLVRAVQAMSCRVPMGGQYTLTVDATTLCNSPQHIAILIVGIVWLLFAIYNCVRMFVMVYRYRHYLHRKEALDPELRDDVTNAEMSSSGLKKGRMALFLVTIFAVVVFPFVFVAGFASPTQPAASFVPRILLMGAVLAVTVVLRPFEASYRNWLLIATALTCMLLIVSGLALGVNPAAGQGLGYVSGIAVLFCFLAYGATLFFELLWKNHLGPYLGYEYRTSTISFQADRRKSFTIQGLDSPGAGDFVKFAHLPDLDGSLVNSSSQDLTASSNEHSKHRLFSADLDVQQLPYTNSTQTLLSDSAHIMSADDLLNRAENDMYFSQKSPLPPIIDTSPTSPLTLLVDSASSMTPRKNSSSTPVSPLEALPGRKSVFGFSVTTPRGSIVEHARGSQSVLAISDLSDMGPGVTFIESTPPSEVTSPMWTASTSPRGDTVVSGTVSSSAATANATPRSTAVSPRGDVQPSAFTAPSVIIPDAHSQDGEFQSLGDMMRSLRRASSGAAPATLSSPASPPVDAAPMSFSSPQPVQLQPLQPTVTKSAAPSRPPGVGIVPALPGIPRTFLAEFPSAAEQQKQPTPALQVHHANTSRSTPDSPGGAEPSTTKHPDEIPRSRSDMDDVDPRRVTPTKSRRTPAPSTRAALPGIPRRALRDVDEDVFDHSPATLAPSHADDLSRSLPNRITPLRSTAAAASRFTTAVPRRGVHASAPPVVEPYEELDPLAPPPEVLRRRRRAVDYGSYQAQRITADDISLFHETNAPRSDKSEWLVEARELRRQSMAVKSPTDSRRESVVSASTAEESRQPQAKALQKSVSPQPSQKPQQPKVTSQGSQQPPPLRSQASRRPQQPPQQQQPQPDPLLPLNPQMVRMGSESSLSSMFSDLTETSWEFASPRDDEPVVSSQQQPVPTAWRSERSGPATSYGTDYQQLTSQRGGMAANLSSQRAGISPSPSSLQLSSVRSTARPAQTPSTTVLPTLHQQPAQLQTAVSSRRPARATDALLPKAGR